MTCRCALLEGRYTTSSASDSLVAELDLELESTRPDTTDDDTLYRTYRCRTCNAGWELTETEDWTYYITKYTWRRI